MPHIPQRMLQGTVFQYQSVLEAEHGEDLGASGFLLGIPSASIPAFAHLYVVSNAHVGQKCPVSRIVKADGTVAILDGTHGADWVDHPDGDDVSVRPLGAVLERDYWMNHPDGLLGPDDLGPNAIGPGDDCLMVGRYIDFRERQFDRPVVRFGNLAMLPESVRQGERGFDQESFLVDMRSVPGYSGSPVFVYFEEPGWRTGHPGDIETAAQRGHHISAIMSRCWLLGVDWGHLGDGMAAVVPAWKLRSLLDTEDLVKARKRTDQELADEHATAGHLDVALPPKKDDGEFERFEDLTRKLVQTPKPKDP